MKEFKFWEVLVLMLTCLIYYHGMADIDIAQKRDAAGFISIDCGMVRNSRYDEDSRLYYSSDAEFIDTGSNVEVQTDYKTNNWTVYNTGRSFPDGGRNCYTLKPLHGNNSNYLIRARFRYGNYDGLNNIPDFDLYIGVNYWTTVELDSLNTSRFYELIYTPSEGIIYVCLVKTGSSTPFISALELKPLNNSIYNKSSGGALSLRGRFAASINGSGDAYYSDPDDPYDREWGPLPASLNWGSVTTNISTYTNAYELPPSVLKTAAIPVPSNASLVYHWKMGSDDTGGQVYVYWHFAEIQKLGTDDIREFMISMTGNFQSRLISPKYLQSLTIVSPPTSLSESAIEFSINKTRRSKLPPILNALELYEVVDLSTLATDQDDVNAIMNIKMNYAMPKSWQGDPCFTSIPNDPWDGLQCDSAGPSSPRITSLTLILGQLKGEIIPHSLSALTALTYLNLSFNNLTGIIPDFLADLPFLQTIDLRSNKLTGQVPIALSKKVDDGSLNLRLEDNPDLCIIACKKKDSKKMAVILATIISIIFICTVIAVLICLFKKKKPAKSITKTSKKLDSRGFTYFEVMNMTKNFKIIIGRGGSGVVYQGTLQDGTPVAVKMLNTSSTLSSKLFHTEDELLTRVHHRNLVSLIGYCEEGTTMALIYEHVTNGNLHQHLSEENVNVLWWKQRLQIAVDAAQGLEYLHNGCKPPIVHRDMKTSNILLDENLHAKISDFGISKVFSVESTESNLTTNVRGTHGYVDPEYYSTKRLNKKSDVYSFGVILLELITGYPSIIKGSGQPIHIIAWTTPKLESGDIENIVDKRLQGHFSNNSAWKAIEIAMTCVSSTAIQRPSMNQVLIDLNDCLAIEIAYERNRGTNDHEYVHENAIADTSIEMGPSAR